MKRYTPEKDGRSWIITPKDEGWVFDRTYPTKWKAHLALSVWLQGGRPSDYFAAARAEKERRTKERETSREAGEAEQMAGETVDSVPGLTPSYAELVQLNPRLASKTEPELHALISAIRECGYQWHPRDKLFFHPGMKRSVRTQGLDWFTADRFRKAHRRQAQLSPEAARRARNSQQVGGGGCALFALTALWALGGWALVEVREWLVILAVSVGVSMIAYGLGLRQAKRAGNVVIAEESKN